MRRLISALAFFIAARSDDAISVGKMPNVAYHTADMDLPTLMVS